MTSTSLLLLPPILLLLQLTLLLLLLTILLLLLPFLLLLLANLLLLLSLLLLLNYSNIVCILLLNFQIYLLQVFKITKHTLNLIDYFCRCINYAIFQIFT